MPEIARAIGLEAYSFTEEWRAPLRLGPTHRREFVYGFLLRLIVGLAAVAIPSVVVILIGALNGWHLTNGLLVFYGLFICAMVLTGEHVRSRVYERFVKIVKPSIEPAKADLVFEGITADIQKGRPVRTMSPGEARLKRVFDILLASMLLWLMAPILIVVAIAIKFETPGPVLFRQTRKGFNGRSFSLLRFRTMYVFDDGLSLLVHDDPRVTMVGSYLRKTSFDELPQLFNVLLGDMSLVGPRPHTIHSEFEEVLENFAFRHHVKPGLTGWAQIHGLRGLAPTLEYAQRRLDYDLWYIDNWSLGLDISILIRTPIEVLRERAY